MQVSIELSGFKEVVELLDVFQRTHVKFALQESLNKGLAPALKQYEELYIAGIFNNPKPLTTDSPMTSEWANFSSLQINFKHRDKISGGTPPAVYLRPQVTDGPVNVTRMNIALRERGLIGPGDYMKWWGDGRGSAAPSEMTGGFAQRVLASLNSPRGEFFILPRRSEGGENKPRRPRSVVDTGYRGPGLYRYSSANRQVEKVFSVINSVPVVRPKYNWSAERLERVADRVFTEALIDNLDKALRR